MQDCLREERTAARVAALLAHDNVHVFVCGDGAAMVKGVHEALVHIVAAGGDVAAANRTLLEMGKAGRYVRDVWS